MTEVTLSLPLPTAITLRRAALDAARAAAKRAERHGDEHRRAMDAAQLARLNDAARLLTEAIDAASIAEKDAAA
jgi:hypothetical protein